MIECPQCKSKAVSVVSVVNSKKNEKAEGIISTIQAFAAITFVISCFFVLTILLEDAKLLVQVIAGTYEITYAAKDIAKMIGDIIFVKMATSSFGFLLKIIIGCAIFKLFLPYRTYSYQKCICRACEFQWEYTPPAGIADIGSEHNKP